MISACQSSQSMVFSNHCSAPCWRDINPGKTSFSDASELIKKFPDIDISSLSVGSSNSFIGFYLNSGEHVRVYLLDDVVALITFYNPARITFENCIKELGVPEYAVQWSILGSGLPIIPASDAKHTWFAAMNPKKGVFFSYDTYQIFGKDNNLTPDTNVSEISFFDPIRYLKLFDAGLLLRYPLDNISQDQLYSWNGYGNIDELYPLNK
jgi:hypothetical protein